MDAATSIIVLIMLVALLATFIRLVSKAIKKAKREQIRYEKKNPDHYI